MLVCIFGSVAYGTAILRRASATFHKVIGECKNVLYEQWKMMTVLMNAICCLQKQLHHISITCILYILIWFIILSHLTLNLMRNHSRLRQTFYIDIFDNIYYLRARFFLLRILYYTQSFIFALYGGRFRVNIRGT